MADLHTNNYSDRLKNVRKHFGLSQKEFANRAKILQSQVSEIENGKKNITAAISIAIEDAFEVSRKWLMSGEGKMIKDNSVVEVKAISLADPDGEHRTGERIYELPDGQKVMEVKIVPARGQAGYLVGFPDPEYYEDLPTLPINVNGNHRGNYLAFEVRGDSMTPNKIEDIQDAILEGWHVVGRELPRHHWTYKLHTHKHSFWIIVHKWKGVLIKQIADHNVEKGTITIHSLNPTYNDEVLNLDDVAQIFSGIKRIINDR